MSILETKAERDRAEYANLTKHYRAIGPGAIAAAVMVARKRKHKIGRRRVG